MSRDGRHCAWRPRVIRPPRSSTLWSVFRLRNVWAGIVPGAVGLIANLSYLPDRFSAFLFLYLFFAALLMVRMHALDRQKRWERQRTSFPNTLGRFTLWDGTGFALLVFLIAVLLPARPALGGLNFLATIITLRAPGMTWGRLPIFVWSVFAAALISLTATKFVALGLLMVTFDRVFGMSFFNAGQGGDAILYEHVFWFYLHPAVYVMILPAFGTVLEVLAHFSRKPVFAYNLVVASFLSIVALSFVVWAHHLFTSGMANYLHIPFMVMTELISIPTGMVFLAALGTIWQGRLWLRTPMLFALAVVFNMLIDGITGIFLADVPTDIHLQDTYFIVAHFHYTIMGGEVFAIMAGVYFWFPKITGRMYSEALGKLHFALMFVLFNATFLAMFWVGNQGMNRRVTEYDAELVGMNLVVSILSFLLAASFLVFVINMARSLVQGPTTEANPWRASTLEWQTSSSPPVENFPVPPRVVGFPYPYGIPSARHGVIAPVGGSGEAEEPNGRA